MNMNFDNPFALATRPSTGMNTSLEGVWGASTPSTALTTRNSAAIIRRGSQAMVHESARATLAACAIESVITLSAIATQGYRDNPFSEADYRRLISAFAAGAAMNIMAF